jgi:HAD superfamily hydrolase (TIGR01509 family)
LVRGFLDKLKKRLRRKYMDWVDDFQLFLFDFDGLLVDTEHLHFLAYKNLLQKKGFQLPWDFSTFCLIAHKDALGLKQEILQLFPDLLKISTWDAFYQEKKQEYVHCLHKEDVLLMPGVEGLLVLLAKKGKKRCVVTNSTKEQTLLLQKRNQALQTIPFWITREDYVEPKPSSECYLKAIQRHAEKEDKVIGFEDSMRGYAALRGTKALSVLICAEDHPQMKNLPSEVIHFSSFEEIDFSHSFKFKRALL